MLSYHGAWAHSIVCICTAWVLLCFPEKNEKISAKFSFPLNISAGKQLINRVILLLYGMLMDNKQQVFSVIDY